MGALISRNSNGNTALHRAVMKSKDRRQIKALIDAGTDVNTQNSDGNTALHLCLLNTKRFSLASLEPLVDDSASEGTFEPLLNQTITVNENLLEDFDIAETLIDEGADLNIQNSDGNTPLHLALINSKPSKLVQKSYDRRDHLNKQCSKDVNVRKLASQKSDVYRLVQKMTDKGADVDKQNHKGNTVIHLAMSSRLELVEAVYEKFKRHVDSYVYLLGENNESRSICYYVIELVKFNNDFEKQLEILSIKSDTICVRNRLGMDPIQIMIEFIKRKNPYLQIFSMWMTFVPLLYLEYHGHITYHDFYGNTLLQFLIESYPYRVFIILKPVELSHLKFNVQNQAGNTPLHIASARMIVYILSNCDNVDLFARNNREETFLHTMLKSSKYDNDYLFLERFLQGQCEYCSKEDIRNLLLCRDIAGNTPLHVYISNSTQDSDCFLHLFHKAGADMNAYNISKESILHCLARNNTNEANIKFAIDHGAEVNAHNVFGESPIFVVRDINKRHTDIRYILALLCLVESGADFKICNKTGQNPLMSMNLPLPMLLYKYKSDMECLVKKCSLKVKDIHGNNIMHYVAWHGMYIDDKDYCDNVTFLLDAGAEREQDAQGQLPCYIAHQMGHVKLARILCKCDNTEHLDIFTFSKQCVQFTQIMQNIQPTQNFENRNYFLNSPIADILNEPFVGSVKFEGEAEEVRLCIVNVIRDICKRLGQENNLLTNKVVQSGSVSENTKIGLPDEFDFMCVFESLSEACVVKNVSKQYPAYACIKLKEGFGEDWRRSVFDKGYYFIYYTFRDIFMTALKDTVQCFDIYKHPNITFKRVGDGSMDPNEERGPNVELHFVWTGRKYKGMRIKVDLVPAIQIKGWWPPGAKLDSLACDTEQTEQLRRDGALLVLHSEYLRGYVQISTFTAEKMHLKSLSQEARNAYIIAKILCSRRVCPVLKDSQLEKINITSYILKNCMFHVQDKLKEPVTVGDYVCKIFRYLIECTKTKKLPSYVYPRCNIFAKLGMQRDYKEICRRIYSQIILNMIGSMEVYLPTDFDELFGRGIRYAEETRFSTTEPIGR